MQLVKITEHAIFPGQKPSQDMYATIAIINDQKDSFTILRSCCFKERSVLNASVMKKIHYSKLNIPAEKAENNEVLDALFLFVKGENEPCGSLH